MAPTTRSQAKAARDSNPDNIINKVESGSIKKTPSKKLTARASKAKKNKFIRQRDWRSEQSPSLVDSIEEDDDKEDENAMEVESSTGSEHGTEDDYSTVEQHDMKVESNTGSEHGMEEYRAVEQHDMEVESSTESEHGTEEERSTDEQHGTEAEHGAEVEVRIHFEMDPLLNLVPDQRAAMTSMLDNLYHGLLPSGAATPHPSVHHLVVHALEEPILEMMTEMEARAEARPDVHEYLWTPHHIMMMDEIAERHGAALKAFPINPWM